MAARAALVLALLANLAWAQENATLVITTRPDGASVVIDGQEQGKTPATLSVPLPDGHARTVRVELRLAGHEPRLASLTLGPGETVVWTGIVLTAGGEVVRPTDTAPSLPVPAPAAALPAGWPDYLAGYKPVPGLMYRISPQDGMPQVLIPAGEFSLGSTPEQIERAVRMATQTGTPEEERLRGEGPAHRVRLSAYWLDLHEVTVVQFCAFLNAAKPSADQRLAWVKVAGEEKAGPFLPQLEQRDGRYVPLKGAERLPVTYVSWDGAQAYARWAHRRLPTEAEYERAARGGVEGGFFAWPDDTPPPAVANLCDASHVAKYPQIKKPGRWFVGYDDGYEGLAPVATFTPNGFGAFDLIGNVWEWCQDAYDPAYYAGSPGQDPVNEAATATQKVLRGGAFTNAPWAVRPACRLPSAPGVCGYAFGFRCVAPNS